MTDLGKFMSSVIMDVEQATKIIQEAGAEAFAVFFFTQAQKTSGITLVELTEVTGMSREQVENACYRLGLNMLDIEE